jgi:hypothetical protein
MFRRIILPSSSGSRRLDLALLDLEDKSTTTLKNVGNYSPNNTASLSGRPESLTFPVSGQGDGGSIKRRRRTVRRRRKRGGKEDSRGWEEEEEEEEEEDNDSHQSHLHE